MSGSSFARVHRILLSEPTHMEDEDEDEDQENEVEVERDGEECRVESRRESKQPHERMKHGMTCATQHTLSQCHVRHCYECRENTRKYDV